MDSNAVLTSEACPLTHELVRDQLRRRVGTQWRMGDRIPPIRQIARELGVGESSTFQAVRELVRAGVLASRPRRGTFVTAMPQTLVAPAIIPKPKPRASLADKRIEVLTLTPRPEPFVGRMIESFEAAMRQSGCEVTRDVVPLEGFGKLDQRNADAVVLFNPSDHQSIVCGPNQVLVIVNTALETPVAMAGRFDVVSVDQEQGGFLAGRRLRELGCKNVCFIGRSARRKLDLMDQTCVARLAGFERGWGEPLPTDRIIVAKYYSTIAGAREVPKWLEMEPRPDGIFAATDEIALGMIFGASAHGLEPGRDFQVVGFDGQQRGRDLPEHPLTTIDVPGRDMGQRAAELLLERLENPDQPVRRLSLGCTLFEGATALANRTS
jgi:DNA-binding LacI/PurR family transcriptional regulator